MTDDPGRTWQRLSDEYLRQIAKALDRTGHPRRGEVLEDVKAHLERLYEELPAGERTPGRMEAVIAEMGEPAEYAEMLRPDQEPSTWSILWRRRGVRLAAGLLLAGVAGVALLLWPFTALPALSTALYVCVLVALVVGYVRTRNSGFIWLGAALVLWPAFWTVLGWTVIRPSIDQLFNKEPVGIFPFTLVEQGRITVGSLMMGLGYINQIGRYGLLLIALVKLAGMPRRPRQS